VDAVGALRGKPSGTIRITATKHAVSTVVMPCLPRFLASYPDIRVDVIVDDNLTDIVAERIDAGIRFGDIVEKDMIAVRIGPDIRMAVVGAPSYFADHKVPQTPANSQAIAVSTTGMSGQAGSTLGISRTRGGR
jgi:DNA-binding transcriptional LysR family regulator